MTDHSNFLADALLAIYNDLQLALDYFEYLVAERSRQSDVALQSLLIENIKVRFPFVLASKTSEDENISEEGEDIPHLHIPRAQLYDLDLQMSNRLVDIEDMVAGQVVNINVHELSDYSSAMDVEKVDSGILLIAELELNLT